MIVSDNKTVPTKNSVKRFIHKVEHAGRREDASHLLKLMTEVSGEDAVLWHPSIIGFGQYHYKYNTGREGDAFLTGFSPRKANMVVYIMPGFASYATLLSKLGKHKTGASCLYLGRLSGVDEKVLRRLIERSINDMRKRYPG